MPKGKNKSRGKAKAVWAARLAPQETQTAEAATVAWTVMATMVLACDVAAIGAHLYAGANPGEVRVAVFRDLVLFAGTVIGVATLAMIPVVYRLRRVPPPTGFAVFAACVAAAPIVAVVARALR